MTDAPLSTRVIRAGYVSADDAPTVTELGRQFDRWLAGVKAEAVRDAARAANQGFVDEQAGIGPARVRTDWLFDYADRIALSASAGRDPAS